MKYILDCMYITHSVFLRLDFISIWLIWNACTAIFHLFNKKRNHHRNFQTKNCFEEQSSNWKMPPMFINEIKMWCTNWTWQRNWLKIYVKRVLFIAFDFDMWPSRRNESDTSLSSSTQLLRLLFFYCRFGRCIQIAHNWPAALIKTKPNQQQPRIMYVCMKSAGKVHHTNDYESTSTHTHSQEEV